MAMTLGHLFLRLKTLVMVRGVSRGWGAGLNWRTRGYLGCLELEN